MCPEDMSVKKVIRLLRYKGSRERVGIESYIRRWSHKGDTKTLILGDISEWGASEEGKRTQRLKIPPTCDGGGGGGGKRRGDREGAIKNVTGELENYVQGDVLFEEREGQFLQRG